MLHYFVCSRIKGTNFEAIFMDIKRFHEAGYPPNTTAIPLVQNTGQFHYRHEGEEHYNSPSSMAAEGSLILL